MHPIIRNTFGGLSRYYYFRQFIFGLIIPVFIIFMLRQSSEPIISVQLLFFFAINSLLYPYSKFVYEKVLDFIIGDNIIIGNIIFMLFMKLLTIAFCWGSAIFIAPVGLTYLYFYHSKKSSDASD